MTTVERIKHIAKEQGRSLTYLCKQLGFTSRTYFNDIEKNNRDIPIDKLTQIAAILGVTVDYLLGNSDIPSKAEKPADYGELQEDVIIYHRDGKTVRKKFTKEQMDMLQAMIDAIPETPKDI